MALEPLYVEVRVDGGAPFYLDNNCLPPYSRMSGIATHVQGGDVDAQKIQINGQLVIDSNGQWVGDSPPVNWSSISDVPADLSDGDDDTQLTENQVEDFVQNDHIEFGLSYGFSR